MEMKGERRNGDEGVKDGKMAGADAPCRGSQAEVGQTLGGHRLGTGLASNTRN